MITLAKALLFLVIVPIAAFAAEGVDAGYAWAEEHDITEESACRDRNGGPLNGSQSFTNGCLDYVRALEEDAEEDE